VRRLNNLLFKMADFLGRPPGFYGVLVLMIISTALLPLGLTDVVTYALSVAAIIITGVVLIQGYRDTAAIHAKLDEIIVALRQAHNDVVGLEHEDPKDIVESLNEIERRAKEKSALASRASPVRHNRAVGSSRHTCEDVTLEQRSPQLYLLAWRI
jgi:low affinity Fe/Cu permease